MESANGNKAVKEEVKREKYEVAKRCLDNGMSVETSAQISGLTIEEVEAIKRENA